MNELISRQKLIEKISKLPILITEDDDFVDLDAVLYAINSQPPAYDVEAVVRELEEKIKHHWERANYCHDNELYIAESEHIGKCEAFRETIEIVRGEQNERTD